MSDALDNEVKRDDDFDFLSQFIRGKHKELLSPHEKLIRIPKFVPRDYQFKSWNYLDKGGSRVVKVHPRRCGKTYFNVAWQAYFLLTKRRGLGWMVLPEYGQGERAIWSAFLNDGTSLLDNCWPDGTTKKFHDKLMRVYTITGSIWQVLGALKASQSLVGGNPISIVVDEYSIMSPSVWDYLSPIINANEGHSIFSFTPRGKNHAYDFFMACANNPSYFVERLTIDETKHIKDYERVLAEEMAAGVPYERIRQEYYTDFNVGVVGSYYENEYERLEASERIVDDGYNPNYPVHTSWDLGMNDTTAIVFFQIFGGRPHFIDAYENRSSGVEHYGKILQKKANDFGYKYGEHWAPFDVETNEWGTGVHRIETAKSYGIYFRKLRRKKGAAQERIEATRKAINIGFFHRNHYNKKEHMTNEGIEYLLKCVQDYHEEYDEDKRTLKGNPDHNWSCNYADALGYGCQAIMGKYLRQSSLNKFQPAISDWDVTSDDC